MRPRSSTALLLLSATAIVAGACAVSPDSAPPGAAPAPTSLRDAKIPAEFTFASTRKVGIQISVNLKKLPADQELPIEVRNLRNELLVAGKPDDQGKLHVDYPLPLGETQLLVRVGAEEQTITLDDNHAASATFE